MATRPTSRSTSTRARAAATATPATGTPRRVSGRVTIVEGGNEAPATGLVVSALAVSVDSKKPRRLGSALASDVGAFSIGYEAGAPVDLQIVVADPSGGEPLFTSEIREDAGAAESFAIRLDKAPSIGREYREPPAETVAALQRFQAGKDILRAGTKAIATAAVEAARLDRSPLESDRRSVKAVLSKLPEKALTLPTRRQPDESIASAEARIAERTAGNIAAHAKKRRVRFALPASVRGNATVGSVVSQETIQTWAGHSADEDGGAVSLQRIDPHEYVCRSDIRPELLCPALDDASTPAPTEPETPPGSLPQEPFPADDPAADNAEIKRRLDAAVEDVLRGLGRAATPPVNGSRADAGAVDARVLGLSLRPGPADVPAYHDFYQLQIAGEPVWEELLDDDLVTAVQHTSANVRAFGGTVQSAMNPDLLDALVLEGRLVGFTRASDPPAAVVRCFELTEDHWRVLNDDYRTALIHLAEGILQVHSGRVSADSLRRILGLSGLPWAGGNIPDALAAKQHSPQLTRELKEQGARIVELAQRKLDRQGGTSFGQYHPVLGDLERRLREPYSFTAYAADGRERHVNFGLVVHYRQRWEPVTYQAGELVRTLPLTPGEKRRVATKRVTSRKTTRSASEALSDARSLDVTETSRAEEEIVSRAQTSTKLGMSAEGEYDIWISEGTAKSSLERNVANESAETKRRFREAVVRAASEYKRENRVEVVSNDESTSEHVEEGEISNPNDEITVTYLFYELQRRFRVSEAIHRVIPVVFVAHELPPRIDDAWVITHAWILKRVMLDASFAPYLDDLADRKIGDEFALEQMRLTLAQRRRMMEELKGELGQIQRATSTRLAQLRRTIETQAEIQENEDTESGWSFLWENFTGDDTSPEAARMRMEAAREDFERAERAERELALRVEREVSALDQATREYTEALRLHLNRATRIEQMRVHIKDNILHYMQAIWRAEPADQRRLRLERTVVSVPEGTQSYTVVGESDEGEAVGGWENPSLEIEPRFQVTGQKTSTLGEIADIGHLIGFKGNYMVFPLRESNLVTDFMLVPYLHPALGLRDPDELSWSPEDFNRYVCCLKEHMTPEQFAVILPRLQRMNQRLLAAPRRENEEVIVPTGALFVEALPGSHTVMQEDSLFHRRMDAEKAALGVEEARAQLRTSELENLRLAKRLLADELGDPKVDLMIHSEGTPAGVIVNPGDV